MKNELPQSATVTSLEFIGKKEEWHRISSLKHAKFSYSETIVVHMTSENLQIALVGCGGDGKEGQKQVAEAIGKNKDLTCLILLGDNIYDRGVESETDEQFNTKFYQIYPNNLLTFSALGNHEHCCHLFQKLKRGFAHFFQNTVGRENDDKKYAGAHYFVEHAKQDSNLGEKLSIDDRPTKRLLMAGSYYMIEFKHKAQRLRKFMVLDSTTFLFKSEEESKENKDNNAQQEWFLQNYQDVDVIVLHHPVIATAGKRFQRSHEWKIYEDPKPTEDQSGNHGEAIWAWIEKNCDLEKLRGKFWFNAHDHHSSVIQVEQKKQREKQTLQQGYYQFTAGGGGGPLQDIENPYLGNKLLFASAQHSFCFYTFHTKKQQTTIEYRDVSNQRICSFIKKDADILKRDLSGRYQNRNAQEVKEEIKSIKKNILSGVKQNAKFFPLYLRFTLAMDSEVLFHEFKKNNMRSSLFFTLPNSVESTNTIQILSLNENN